MFSVKVLTENSTKPIMQSFGEFRVQNTRNNYFGVQCARSVIVQGAMISVYIHNFIFLLCVFEYDLLSPSLSFCFFDENIVYHWYKD